MKGVDSLIFLRISLLVLLLLGMALPGSAGETAAVPSKRDPRDVTTAEAELSVDTVAGSAEDTQTRSRQVWVLKRRTTTKTPVFEMELEVPVLLGLADLDLQNWLNARLEAPLVGFTSNLRNHAEMDAQEFIADGMEFRPYSAHVNYRVTRNDGRLISIVASLYQYTGGAHGLTYYEPFTLDVKTGKLLQLGDLFAPEVNYKATIAQEVQRQISENPENYFSPRLEQGWEPDQRRFYLTDEGIVIFFDLYEIAPYVAGIPEFLIPFSQLRGVLMPGH